MAQMFPLSCVPAPGNSCATVPLMSSGSFLPSLFTSFEFAEHRLAAQSTALFVSLLFMLLQHGARGDLFSALAVPARFLRRFLDVFVLALLFGAHATHVSFLRHVDLLALAVSWMHGVNNKRCHQRFKHSVTHFICLARPMDNLS